MLVSVLIVFPVSVNSVPFNGTERHVVVNVKNVPCDETGRSVGVSVNNVPCDETTGRSGSPRLCNVYDLMFYR